MVHTINLTKISRGIGTNLRKNLFWRYLPKIYLHLPIKLENVTHLLRLWNSGCDLISNYQKYEISGGDTFYKNIRPEEIMVHEKISEEERRDKWHNIIGNIGR